jgi:polyhydroxyalkanoate synthesis regulator phasin
MKLKSLLFLSLLISFVSVANASEGKPEDKEAEYKSMEQMMGAIRLEKKQVENMVDLMVVSGRITAEEGSKAKREIASMKENDLENLKSRALAEVKSSKLLDH